jgi:hypothetical protein
VPYKNAERVPSAAVGVGTVAEWMVYMKGSYVPTFHIKEKIMRYDNDDGVFECDRYHRIFSWEPACLHQVLKIFRRFM